MSCNRIGHHGQWVSPSFVTVFSCINLPIAPQSSSVLWDFSTLLMWTGMLKCFDIVYGVTAAFIDEAKQSTFVQVSGSAGLS